jgi:hypothetical protein
MARERKETRPRLITLHGILYLYVAIYIGAILYTWWSFVDLMYRTGLIFNQADVLEEMRDAAGPALPIDS